MRFVLLIVWLVLLLAVVYYLTVIAHMWTGLFGKNVSVSQSMIPFYGWFKWLNSKK